MLDDRQKENLGKFFIDIAKIIFAVFVIGGFVPNSPITSMRIILAVVESSVLVLMGLYLLKRSKIDNS